MPRFRQFPNRSRSRFARRGRSAPFGPQTLFGKIGLTIFILLWLALPVTVLVHHALADGSHIALFYRNLKEAILRLPSL